MSKGKRMLKKRDSNKINITHKKSKNEKGEEEKNIQTCSNTQTQFDVGFYEHLQFTILGKGKKEPTKRYKSKDGVWKSKPGCGDFRAAFICANPECGKPHYVKHKCLKKTCPDCYNLWIRDAGMKITSRLFSKEATRLHEGKRLVHLVLSPPKDWNPENEKDLKKLIARGYDYAKSKGVLGGVMIPHAYRVTDYAKKAAKEDGKKIWEWIRDQDDWRSYCYFSPHFHMIAYVNWLDAPNKDEGWVYKTITRNKHVVDFTRKSKRNKEVSGLVGYLLTHAVTLEGSSFESMRWFGSCSRIKFKSSDEEKEALKTDSEPEKKYCKVCNYELMPFWEWINLYYGAIMSGVMPEPEYITEIDNLRNGEPPPKDASDYFVGTEGKERIKT